MLAGVGSPRRMTPSNVLSAGSVTEIVFENCSAAYTRSRWLIATSFSAAPPGACPAKAIDALTSAARTPAANGMLCCTWYSGRRVVASGVERYPELTGPVTVHGAKIHSANAGWAGAGVCRRERRDRSRAMG